MTRKERSMSPALDKDDAPDLSAPEWREQFSSTKLDGVDLRRPRDLGRENFGMGSVEPITSELDYQRALKEIEAYFIREPEPGTPEALHFDALAKRISAYEDEHEAQANSSE